MPAKDKGRDCLRHWDFGRCPHTGVSAPHFSSVFHLTENSSLLSVRELRDTFM